MAWYIVYPVNWDEILKSTLRNEWLIKPSLMNIWDPVKFKKFYAIRDGNSLRL